MPTGYTPPAGNAVNLNFTGAYTPPLGNAVILNFVNINAYVLTATPGTYAITGTPASIKAGYLLRAYSEQVVTGEFETSDVSGWTISGADTTLPVVSGEGRLTLGPGAASGYAYQAIAVTPGQPYTIDTHLIVGNAGSGLSIGTAPGGSQIASAMAFPSVVLVATPTSVATHPLGPVSISFIAPAGGVIYLSLNSGGTNSCYARCAYVRMRGSGVYTLTGSPVTLTKTGRILQADPGSYAMTGSPVSLRVGRRIVADPGVYTQTRTDVKLLIGRRLVADPGSYVMSVSSADITYIVGFFLHAEKGSYALQGSDVRLIYGRRLVATPGSYSLTGADVSWVYRRMIKASPGAYALTGAAVQLRVGYRLAAQPGTYVLTGSDVGLVNRRLIADPGAYALSGSPVGLLAGRRLQATPGVYNLTGTSALLLSGRRLIATPGIYSLLGSDVGVKVGRRLAVAAGVYNLTGAAARLLRGYTVQAVPGSYVLTWATARVITTRRMIAEAGVYRTAWPDVALVPTWTPRGPRSIAVGFAASRYVSVPPQNRRVAVEPQDRRCSVEAAPRRYAAVEPRDKELLGGSMLKWPEKDPNEVLDYELDWADPDEPRLEVGETLLTSVWSVLEGDVVISVATPSTFTPQGLSKVWLTGGTPGTKCVLLNRVTTSTVPRSYDKEVSLRVRDH